MSIDITPKHQAGRTAFAKQYCCCAGCLPYLLLPLKVLVVWILISASPMPPLRMVTLHHSGTLPRRHVYLQTVTGTNRQRTTAHQADEQKFAP